MTQPGEYTASALKLFGISGAKASLLRHNENMTFRVYADAGAYLLRVSRPVEGFSVGPIAGGRGRIKLVTGEVLLLARLAREGLPVPRPIPSADGGYVALLPDGTPATLFAWIDGKTLAESGETPDALRALGETLARLHRAASAPDFPELYRYDYVSALPDVAAELRAAERAGHIDSETSRAARGAVREIGRRFSSEKKLLIHADLSSGNVIITPDGGAALIDFSLSGYAPADMDVGLLFANVSDPALRAAFLEGYGEVKQDIVDAALALGVLLFIACQHGRFHGEDWFQKRLRAWTSELFEPVSKGGALL